MDERAIKRLLVMLAVSIIAILVLKTMLLKTATRVSNVAAERKHAASPNPPAELPTPAPPPVPAIPETPADPLAVTTMDSPAASSVGEAR